MQPERGPPITINEQIQLASLGISHDQVTWSRITMTSNKWISIRSDREDLSANRQHLITVLNPKDGSTCYAGKTTADSVQMNPKEPVIALKDGLRFEVFHLETKVLVNRTIMHEIVVYWTWVNSEILAAVTDSAVYHWNINCGERPPEKMFMRHSRLAFTEITSYKADPTLKWLALTGLAPEEDRISGITQLYNVEEEITQCISAHAVCFSLYRFVDNPSPSTVFCVSTRDLQEHGKVHVIELGPYQQGNFAPRNSYDHIQYLDDVDRYDFPVALHISTDYGLLFVITKYGYLYLCDMETANCLCSTRISLDIIFASALNTDTQGILGVTRGGQVLTVDLKKEGLISYVRDTAKKAQQANRLEKAISR